MSLSVVLLAVALLLLAETGTWTIPGPATCSSSCFSRRIRLRHGGIEHGRHARFDRLGQGRYNRDMFVGRIGPLTAAMALMKPSAGGRKFNYGPEEIMVG